MKCISCDRIDLKHSEGHSRVGFAKCKLSKLAGDFVSLTYERKCENFKESNKEVIDKRIEWMNKK